MVIKLQHIQTCFHFYVLLIQDITANTVFSSFSLIAQFYMKFFMYIHVPSYAYIRKAHLFYSICSLFFYYLLFIIHSNCCDNIKISIFSST